CKPEHEAAPDKNSIGSDGHRLRYVEPRHDAAIHQHGYVVSDRFADDRHQIDRRGRGIELTPAMIGDDDAVHPEHLGTARVIWMQDAFDDQGARPLVPHSREKVPVDSAAGFALADEAVNAAP